MGTRSTWRLSLGYFVISELDTDDIEKDSFHFFTVSLLIMIGLIKYINKININISALFVQCFFIIIKIRLLHKFFW